MLAGEQEWVTADEGEFRTEVVIENAGHMNGGYSSIFHFKSLFQTGLCRVVVQAGSRIQVTVLGGMCVVFVAAERTLSSRGSCRDSLLEA